MAGLLEKTDSMFPSFDDAESLEDVVLSTLNYLTALRSELEYLFTNLSEENFNESEFQSMSTSITGDNTKALEHVNTKLSECLTSLSSLRGAHEKLSETVTVQGEALDKLTGRIDKLALRVGALDGKSEDEEEAEE